MLSAKKYVLENEYPLPRETLWELLSDTDRLNRIIGLFSVQFSNAQTNIDSIFFRKARAKVAGLVPLTWKEYPFEWITNETYQVVREYETGPLEKFIGGIELEDTSIQLQDGSFGTRVRLFAEFKPRNLVGIMAIRFTGLNSMKNTLKYIEQFIKYEEHKLVDNFSVKQLKAKVNLCELDRLQEKLKESITDKKYINLLQRLIVSGDDSDLVNMNPLKIARIWQLDSDQVIRLFLYATKVGILNLSWNLICPNCRVSKANYTSLSQLRERFHCDLCGINYNASFDKNVELNFTIHPSIREAYNDTYCVSGPMITPHVKVQKIIKQGDYYTLDLENVSEGMRIRVLQANHILQIKHKLELLEGNNKIIKYTNEGWETRDIFMNKMVHLYNSSPRDILVVLEKSEWGNEILTASEVSSLQEFRNLFSAEVLSPGQKVGIENITILFTDLQDSTSLYETLGDANAYGHVREHFDYLSNLIGKNSGSVVKTIGDAVMAVFQMPQYGLNAALDIQKNIYELKKKNENIVLKLGLYSGPAIAVNSNDRLDYFGRTVNIAARIQGQSSGNDIVFSKEYLENEQIQQILKKNLVELNQFEASLKGLEDKFDLIKVKLNL